MFEVALFVYPSHHYAWWSPALLEMPEHTCLPMGSGERIPWFHFACVLSFCFIYYTVLILAHEFFPHLLL